MDLEIAAPNLRELLLFAKLVGRGKEGRGEGRREGGKEGVRVR